VCARAHVRMCHISHARALAKIVVVGIVESNCLHIYSKSFWKQMGSNKRDHATGVGMQAHMSNRETAHAHKDAYR